MFISRKRLELLEAEVRDLRRGQELLVRHWSISDTGEDITISHSSLLRRILGRLGLTLDYVPGGVTLEKIDG